MRFQVARRDLEAALQAVGSSIASSGSDISAHFTFRRTGPAKDDNKYGMEVLAYTGSTFSSWPLIVSVDEPGTEKKAGFTLEGWRLKQWLKSTPADSVPEFILDSGEVVARVKKGKQTFQSLDPSTFPYWDKALKEAEVKAKVPADRLAAALATSRLFVGGADKEAQSPDQCVCEVIDGILYASDRKAVSMIRVKGMEEANLRVHGKNIGAVLTFLGTLGDGEVEVLEHDRMTLLRSSANGATFGESRFQFAFPKPKIRIDDVSQHTWAIPKDELQQAIGFLVAGAVKEDNRLRFTPGETAGEVVLSMTSATGKETELPLSGVTMTPSPGVPVIPEEGFLLDHILLTKFIGPWKEETVTLGLTVTGARGHARMVHDHFESKFVAVLPWLA